jgi:hypothetical protein
MKSFMQLHFTEGVEGNWSKDRVLNKLEDLITHEQKKTCRLMQAFYNFQSQGMWFNRIIKYCLIEGLVSLG